MMDTIRPSTDAPLRLGKRSRAFKRIWKNWQLYLFILPALATVVLFSYVPIYGVQIAFKNFIATKGIWGSEWVGFDHFIRFFDSYYFWDLMLNTLGISIYSLLVGFPIPILLALGLNELRNGFFKKSVQTITYAPHFISVVVMAGIILAFLSPETGIINRFMVFFGLQPIAFLSEASWFKTVYVFSDVWQNMGWGTVIYMAALAGIDPQQHEAAIMDGASRVRRIWHINLPGIAPTMIILLILSTGGILNVGFEKILLLQNQLNMDSSDVISTYVYRSGLRQAQYSFSAAVGLFNSVINLIILVAVNWIAKRKSESSLW
ncbi:ABC transporter permease subunit [Paenibacillus mendelii]|nr:ABC transporter permease subunit [Paenibacillus mendelii]MCQ6559516.1 ABC transporter permease subunit [Paenibacillus mendelii]